MSSRRAWRSWNGSSRAAMSRSRSTGAAIAWNRRSGSSGSTARAASTIASATSAMRAAGGQSRVCLLEPMSWCLAPRLGRFVQCSPVILAHLDLDAFFAAVEELEDPTLRTKPLVVGGDPHGRGVVATANYVARRFGIHSAMSCAEALRRCPHAVFVRPRHSVYSAYSRAVWDTVRQVVATVERTGLDEGYLDIGQVVADFSEARRVAEAVQTAV